MQIAQAALLILFRAVFMHFVDNIFCLWERKGDNSPIDSTSTSIYRVLRSSPHLSFVMFIWNTHWRKYRYTSSSFFDNDVRI